MGCSFTSYLGPVFLVCVGLMDPGKWATAMESGSRFGMELLWVLIASSVFAALLHALSLRLGLVTGRNLAQVCREVYPGYLSSLLWIQCEVAVVILDLTMSLGIAMGLNMLLGLPMVFCMALTAADTSMFLFALPHLGLPKAELFTASVITIVLLCFVGEALHSNASTAAMFLGILPKLKGDNLYIAAGILGANIMPSNIYLHSALVQEVQHAENWKLEDVLHHNVIDIVTGFCVALLVNIAVLSSAAAAFHNSGHVVITLQDAQALMEQILSSSVAPVAFSFALLCAGQLSTFIGTIAGQVAAEGLIGVKTSVTIHRLVLKLTAIVVAMLLVWCMGTEGLYQVVIFSQVVLALQLPIAIIPLVKITSSQDIMGNQKNCFLVETVSWMFLGMIFVMDIWVIFDTLLGESDEYMGSGSWNLVRDLVNSSAKWGESVWIVCCLILVGMAILWSLLLIWMISTPVKMESKKPNLSVTLEDYKQEHLERSLLDDDKALWDTTPDHEISSGVVFKEAESLEKPAEESSCVQSVDEPADMPKFLQPEMKASLRESLEVEEHEKKEISEEEIGEKVLKVEEIAQDITSFTPKSSAPLATDELSCDQAGYANEKDVMQVTNPTDSLPILDSLPIADSSSGVKLPLWSITSPESRVCTSDTTVSVKTQKHDEAAQKHDEAETLKEDDLELLDKDDYDMGGWENLEQDDVVQDSLSAVGGSVNSLTFEEPGSGKSFSARSDTSEGSCGGSGSGSLSRLSGLGRSARRQFAQLLDEFWGKLYDLHGHPATQSHGKSRGQRGPQVQMPHHRGGGPSKETSGSEAGWYSSNGIQQSWLKSGRSDLLSAPEIYNGLTSERSKFGGNSFQDASAYMSRLHDAGERRYSSLRYPTNNGAFDNQPATFHGYKYAGRSGGMSSLEGNAYASSRQHQLLPLSSDAEGYQPTGARSMYSFPMMNTSTSTQLNEGITSSSMQSLLPAQHRNEPLGRMPGHSLLTDRFIQQPANRQYPFGRQSWNSVTGHDTSAWDPLVYRATGELDMPHLKQRSVQRDGDLNIPLGKSPVGGSGYPGNLKRRMDFLGESAPLPFDQISPSQSRKDGFSIQTSQNHSLWETPPFEQLFGFSTSPMHSNKTAFQDAIQHKILGQQMEGPCASSRASPPTSMGNDQEIEVLSSLRSCLRKLLKLEGSDWLFRLDSGSDEDLIGMVGTRERVLLEADTRELYKQYANTKDVWVGSNQRPLASVVKKHNELVASSLGNSGVPHCGEGCVWNMELVVSFGVWCIHRVLELALMESRPELWGKYTYVLNRLQGVLDPAFSKPRTVSTPCICAVSEASDSQATFLSRQGSLKDNGMGELMRSLSNGMPVNSFQGYPQSWPWERNTSTGQGKGASSAVFLEIIKEVETAIECRKGRTGTAAGDVAFPKGKENLASVLKRYKRHFGSKGSAKPADGSNNNGFVVGKRHFQTRRNCCGIAFDLQCLLWLSGFGK